MFRTAHQKVADFRKGRERQTDAAFLRDCNLPSDVDTGPNAEPDAERVALAVRRAVATTGLVDSHYIRAADRCPGELELLPLWDSMDWVAFIMAIEDELAISIPDAEAEKITMVPEFSVRGCVHDVLEVVTRLRTG